MYSHHPGFVFFDRRVCLHHYSHAYTELSNVETPRVSLLTLQVHEKIAKNIQVFNGRCNENVESVPSHQPLTLIHQSPFGCAQWNEDPCFLFFNILIKPLLQDAFNLICFNLLSINFAILFLVF